MNVATFPALGRKVRWVGTADMIGMIREGITNCERRSSDTEGGLALAAYRPFIPRRLGIVAKIIEARIGRRLEGIAGGGDTSYDRVAGVCIA